MRYKISITEDADLQFRALPVREQRILEAAILSRLVQQPTTTSKAIKRLRPNPRPNLNCVQGICAHCIMWREMRLSSSL